MGTEVCAPIYFPEPIEDDWETPTARRGNGKRNRSPAQRGACERGGPRRRLPEDAGPLGVGQPQLDLLGGVPRLQSLRVLAPRAIRAGDRAAVSVRPLPALAPRLPVVLRQRRARRERGRDPALVGLDRRRLACERPAR